jgi:hypothetical protein
MHAPGPFPASILRPPSVDATCSCEHWGDCDCACHGRNCDPAEASCDVAFLPDDGGVARWGCAACTPGGGVPHDLGCAMIGWHIPYLVPARRS